MLTNAEPWDNLKFDENGVDEVRRKFFGTLYNTYSFFALYANIEGWTPAVIPSGASSVIPSEAKESLPEIDRWITSKLNTLIREVRAAYEDYDVKTAGRLIETFVCDHVSNWYVRLNRSRFWNGDKDAFQTLYDVLMDVAVLAAPIAPFFMDQLYLDLTAVIPGGAKESVHYVLMPESDATVIDPELEERMALAQQATSMVLALRKKVGIPVRQPLAKMLVPVISDAVRARLEAVKDLILTEVNVKEMEFVTDTTGILTKKIKPNFKTLGKVYGARMKEIAAAFGSLDQATITAIQNAETAGEAYTLALPGGEVVLNLGDYQISSEDMPGWLVASEGALTIALDVELTDDLRREGVARELVNRIQNLRKTAGFEVTDRIDTVIYADSADIAAALEGYGDWIGAQTLSRSVKQAPAAEVAADAREVEWIEGTLFIAVKR
jgi:isoleucyl-tRNA synthetase